MEPVPLITQRVLADLRAPAPSTDGVSHALLREPAAVEAMKSYLALTQQPEWFVSAGWSPESVFWSRYYWFRRFANLRAAAVGEDAGLEQQAIQILESPLPACDPDWSQLESVNRRASIE